MSRSSLWIMDKEYRGTEIKEYGNAWLFSPVVWSVLLDKYMHHEIQTPYGYKKNMITDGQELFPKLNDLINNCTNLTDRICWEFSNQQILFTKDKNVISQAIRDFVSNNIEFFKDDDGIPVLKREHISKRFYEIADDIQGLDESTCINIIFKNTSVDDGVECWFSKYDENTKEYVECPLSESDTAIVGFVIIENDNIEFVSNTEFFKAASQQKPN